MDMRYTRLKLKMLLLVVAGTLTALAAALFLWDQVVEGLLRVPFAQGAMWVAQHLFGMDEAAAVQFFQEVFRDHKGGWLALKRLCKCHPFHRQTSIEYDPVP